jgi:hypothetical protein
MWGVYEVLTKIRISKPIQFVAAVVMLTAPRCGHAESSASADNATLLRQVQGLQQQVQVQQQHMEAQERQMQAMLHQVQVLQQQVATNNHATVFTSSAKPQSESPAVSNPAAVASSAHPVTISASAGEKPSASKVKLTVGGFIESAAIYRTRNEVADIGSNFNTGIPYPNIGPYHEHEFRGSARQSRLSLLATGDVDSNLKLSGYFEGDFLGAAPTSNSLESNSYTPRLRQAYVEIDRPVSGIHFVTGQSWSLATLERESMLPGKENLPLTIDAQYVPGFNWTRNWQVRAVKDFDGKKIWAGVSAESPQAIIFSGPNVPGGNTNFINAGGSGFASSVNYSTDLAPDLIAKLAFDPGWGHYEVYGLGRFFSDRRFGGNSTVFGGGAGAGAILPLIDKKLEFQISGLAGEGIGRYGSSQLPDVTVKPDGTLSPVREVDVLAGFIAHPGPEWDAYLYSGTERAQRNSFVSSGLGFGYGSSLYNNSGCLLEGSAKCVANTSSITQVTAGTWWKFYHGDYGVMKAGIQNSYTWRNIFSGVGGGPQTNDDITMLSFRYYPF